MRRTIGFFIEGNRLDLFQDEQIEITSSIQNVQDIAKVFTDFSQTFTVPTSPNNSAIFNHFYESDVSFREGVSLDHNLRRDAFIEIDSILYRRGQAIIEESELVNGRPESYKVTFYGELVSLKDILSEYKLNELDWSAFDFEYTFDEVVDRVEIPDSTTNYDVRYPLISSTRYWQYNNPGLPAENINTTTGAINWTELFPALRLTKVIETIEAFFDIEFVGTFLNDPKIQEAWLWFKNKNETSYITPPIDIDFISAYNTNTNNIGDNDTLDVNGLTGVSSTISTETNTIRYYYTQYELLGSITDSGNHIVKANITVSNQEIEYYIDVYRNGYYFSTFTGVGDGYHTLSTEENTNNQSLDTEIYLVFRSSSPLSVTMSIDYSLFVELLTIGDTPINPVQIQVDPITTIGNQSLGISAPDIKVYDFLTGLIKMFNLTLVPVDERKYELVTLEEWYIAGRIFDITEYVQMDNIQIARVPLYKDVDFMYEKSNSLLNREFQSLFYREYGDLSNQFPYNGGKYEIKLPFENILFQKFDETSTLVGYTLNENLQGYTPKPVILYKSESLPTSIYFTDGTVNREIEQYEVFSADGYYNANYYSLNWGAEISPLYEAINPNSLYSVYYKAYIENLFSRKNRLTTIKTKLPLWIITELLLNDRLVIRDKRYTINSLKTNLSTGESTIELLNDFRKILPEFGVVGPIKFPPEANCYQYLVKFQNGVCSATITYPPVAGFSVSPTTLTESGYVEICVPEVEEATYIVQEPPILAGKLLTQIINPEIITEQVIGLNLVTEDSALSNYQITITYNYCTGGGYTEIIDVVQYG